MIRDRLTTDAASTVASFAPSTHISPQVNPVTIPGKRVIANRYRLCSLLGKGGMGAVWLAHDDLLRRTVALKEVTHPERGSRSHVLREARGAAQIAHPGVVLVHDVLIGDDGCWIVMEALPGKPLSHELRSRGRLPVEEAAQITVELLSALDAIHAGGLVHRDVKPSNVQLCGGSRVVLTDFGLCSRRGGMGEMRNGFVDGSLPYLAPESILEGSFGPASDLYAVGVTLYEMVEGRRPFDVGDPWTVLDQAAHRVPKPPHHAGTLRTVVDGLLENDPARRMDADTARAQLQAVHRPSSTKG
jgi:serine/threonine protein kinase